MRSSIHDENHDEPGTPAPRVAPRSPLPGRLGALSPAIVLALQRTAGNAAVTAALSRRAAAASRTATAEAETRPDEATVYPDGTTAGAGDHRRPRVLTNTGTS